MNRLEELYDKLSEQRKWGTYHMGKYYFSIHTGRTRESLGLRNGDRGFSPELQLQLQNENLEAIYHEYIHYVHEMSTLLGHLGLGLEIAAKAYFSNNFVIDSKSCEVIANKDRERWNKIAEIFQTQFIWMGDTASKFEGRKFIRIESIKGVFETLYVPDGRDFIPFEIESPKVSYYVSENQSAKIDSLMLGKFFIYEGIAYELDRELERIKLGADDIQDQLDKTEYTVLRYVARFVFSEVKKETFLKVASMSLQYINPGFTFVTMLMTVKLDVEHGMSQESSVDSFKRQVSEKLRLTQEQVNAELAEYVKVYEKRPHLQKAFSYLTDQMKKLYTLRIENPTFEIDSAFSDNPLSIRQGTDMCDLMYIFEGEDSYCRDFLGTSIDIDTSIVLKAMLSYDHYHKCHQLHSTEQVEREGDHACPFYHCCDLPYRRDHANLCATRPWRLYEVSMNTRRNFCWYGRGVAEFKGFVVSKDNL